MMSDKGIVLVGAVYAICSITASICTHRYFRRRYPTIKNFWPDALFAIFMGVGGPISLAIVALFISKHIEPHP
jgi:hypothetical protein